jgi:hypothetical protein
MIIFLQLLILATTVDIYAVLGFIQLCLLNEHNLEE